MNDILTRARHRDLLEIFLTNKDYISSVFCSNELKVSDRTIKSDIYQINEQLKPLNIQIVSKRGRGYKLKYDDEETLYDILSKETYDSQGQERLYNIIILLLSQNKTLNLFDIEDILHISRSTLEQDLKHLKTLLKNSYSSIKVNRKSDNISLIGDEFTLRLFFNKILTSRFNVKTQTLDIKSDCIDNKEFDNIRKKIIIIMSNYNIDLYDSSIADLTSYLLITKSRIKLLKEIETEDEKNNTVLKNSDKLSDIAKDLFNQIVLEDIKCKNILNEEKQLAIKLSFLNIYFPTKMSKNEVIKNIPIDITDAVQRILNDINFNYNINLSIDDELFVSIAFLIMGLINRERYPEIIKTNAVTNTIKQKYPDIFDISLTVHKILNEIFSINLTENELGNIAARIAAAIKKNVPNKRVRVAVLSHYNASYTNLLCENLKNKFYTLIEIIGVYHVYNMENAIDKIPDIIVHTFNIKRNIFPKEIKTLKVNFILSKSDKIELFNMIETIQYPLSNYPLISKFDEELFFKDTNLKSKEEIIALMTNILIMKDYVPNDFLSKILEKESLSGTVINESTAILSPLEACANKSKIGVMTLKDSVSWSGYNVKLVFIIALTKEDKNELGNILAIIHHIILNEYQFEQILNALNFKTFIEVFKNGKI